jgi:hypothetical protein
VSDGAGGAIVVWYAGSISDSDVPAQRIDANGDPLWTIDGRVVCSAAGSQNTISAIPDGGGGAIAVWEDDRGSFTDVYAQRITASGAVIWTTDGVAICTAPFDQERPKLLTDGSGGAMFVWQDNRDQWDIYSSMADATGQLVPTFLKAYDVVCHDGAIVVLWSVSSTQEIGQFAVFRMETSGARPWERIAVAIEGEDGKFQFSDETCIPGSSYRYRVDVTDETGRRTLFETDATTIPGLSLALHQNAPNPFNPTTTIRYSTSGKARVSIRIYNGAGQLVRTLVDQLADPGGHVVTWDGLSNSGKPVSSGVYFYRLASGDFSQTRKMVLLK